MSVAEARGPVSRGGGAGPERPGPQGQEWDR